MTPITKHTLTPDQVKCTGPWCTAYKQWLLDGQQGDPPSRSEYRRGRRGTASAGEPTTSVEVDDEDDWIIEAV